MYSCVICKEDFPSRQLLYKHLINHKTQYGCHKCDKIFNTKGERKRHSRLHAQETCDICKETYEKLNHKEHTKYHQYLYSIDQLNGIVDIINHMQGKPTNPSPQKTKTEYRGTQPKCPVDNCDKTFPTQNDLINHFINHRATHLCQFCDEIFPNYNKYHAHYTGKMCRAYSCLNCGKEFSVEKFVRHIMLECANNLFDNADDAEPIETKNTRKIYRIFGEINYNFTCFLCEDEFENMELLTNHLKEHNKKLNVCGKCFCVFDDGSEFKDHELIGCEEDDLEELLPDMRTKLRDEIETFLRIYAEKRRYLETNIKVYEMFEDVVLFQCNVCNIKFVKFKYLREHCIKLQHKLIMCYNCMFMFNTVEEKHNHWCIKCDYNSVSELNFCQKFRKNWDFDPKTETPPVSNKPATYSSIYARNDHIISRMNDLIEKLENTKFPDRKVTKTFKDTPTPTTSVNVNDEYDLNKILPRIMERRKKRLCRTVFDDEDKELEQLENNLNDLDIGKKHLLIENTEYDLDKVLPRIIERRNKRLLEYDDDGDDETIENIAKFLREFEAPPNKKFRPIDSDDDEFRLFNDEIWDDDFIPNKKPRY